MTNELDVKAIRERAQERPPTISANSIARDVELAAYYRADVPALCDEVERLRGELAVERANGTTMRSYLDKTNAEYVAARARIAELEGALIAKALAPAPTEKKE